MKNWMNEKLPGLIDKLETSFSETKETESGDNLGYTGNKIISDILDDLLSVLFPSRYSRTAIRDHESNFFLNDTIRHIIFKFRGLLEDVLHNRCMVKNCSTCNCELRSEDILIHLLESLPEIRKILLTDISAALKGDPAAGSLDEIILSYPFVDAIATHRIAHILYELGVPAIPRIMSERSHSLTGIDIHPGAKIEPGFFIDHGTGVVIGETCRIGKNVMLYQGVTLGALSPFDKDGKPRVGEKRHPDVEDDVIIYSNSTILGGKTVIGKGSIIGANTWITKSVPPGSIILRDHTL